MSIERTWDGKTITEPGVWKDIPLSIYHGRADLFDAPSISKSSLKWLLPTHGGSPKAFWGRWAANPDRVEPKTSDALDFGKAAHAKLLGDEDFSSAFAIRPEEFKDYGTKAARQWRDEMLEAGRTPITPEQDERIDAIRADASQHPMIRAGILNGRIERTLAWKDPETGLWLRARPDAMPPFDGVFADLKTTSSLSEDFLGKQLFDAGYYLQAAMTRMVCRGLRIPFDSFVLVYVLNDDVPDTTVVEVDEYDIDRGERAVRWCLRTIRHCLDEGEWPGARPFGDGARRIGMKPWAKTQTDEFLSLAEQMPEAA